MVHIGARTLKTGLAVFICLVIAVFMPQTGGNYSCLAAVICMMPSTEQTITAGINRTFGTALSGIAAAIVLSLYAFLPRWYELVRIVLIPIFTILIILACNMLHRSESAVLSCAIFIYLALSPVMSFGEVFAYTAWRLAETVIGITVAMLVNNLIYPPPKTKQEAEKKTVSP